MRCSSWIIREEKPWLFLRKPKLITSSRWSTSNLTRVCSMFRRKIIIFLSLKTGNKMVWISKRQTLTIIRISITWWAQTIWHELSWPALKGTTIQMQPLRRPQEHTREVVKLRKFTRAWTDISSHIRMCMTSEQTGLMPNFCPPQLIKMRNIITQWKWLEKDRNRIRAKTVLILKTPNPFLVLNKTLIWYQMCLKRALWL